MIHIFSYLFHFRVDKKEVKYHFNDIMIGDLLGSFFRDLSLMIHMEVS